MTRRHLISLENVDDLDLQWIVDRGVRYAEGDTATPLRGRVVGVHFRRTSTRTRTAFSVAALRLGAQTVTYGPADLQTETGETVADTARVLSGMLDGFVTRTADDIAELRLLAAQERMSVINAMAAQEHPTQALADLTTMRRLFGRLEGLRILYIGEGNNTAAALALAVSRFPGVRLDLRTPPGYGLAEPVRTAALKAAARHDVTISERHDMEPAPKGADIIYTTRWETTGTTKPTPDWRATFSPFQVNETVMAAHPGAVLMHDLPAHRGDEVTPSVLDGSRSVAFQQAEHKLHSAMAVLEWCVTGPVDIS